MTTKELKVGNLIFFVGSYHGAKKKIVEVIEIRRNSLVTVEKSNNQIFGVDIENAEGIRLTPEILQKLGFDEVEDWLEKWYPVIGELITNEDKTYIFDVQTKSLKIEFLHQLQNLIYSLTGKELDLKDFKI